MNTVFSSTLSSVSVPSLQNNALTACFQQGRDYEFQIISLEFDGKANRNYFVLRDRIVGGTHRYYFTGTHGASVGDTIVLTYKELTQTGRLFLVEPVRTISQAELSRLPLAPDYTGVLESGTLEFKSSFVFTGKGEKNMDKQLGFEIMQQMAGMMNTSGGTVVVGVANDGSIRGINRDIAEVNSSQHDKFSYPVSLDGMALKIRNTIDWALGARANLLTDISFAKSASGEVLCLITVRQSDTPRLYKGTTLYVRNGNTSIRLIGEDMTAFIARKTTPAPVPAAEPVTKPAAVPRTQVKKAVHRYLTFYRGGFVSLQKKQITSPDVLMELPLSGADSRNKKARLVLCYADGKINVLNPQQLIKKKFSKEGQRYQNGFCTNTELTAVLVGSKEDRLAIRGEFNGVPVEEEISLDILPNASMHTPGRYYGAFRGMDIKGFSLL